MGNRSRAEADVFWGMHEVDQADFFNILGKEAGYKIGFQMAAVDKYLNEHGRYLLSTIGEYGK